VRHLLISSSAYDGIPLTRFLLDMPPPRHDSQVRDPLNGPYLHALTSIMLCLQQRPPLLSLPPLLLLFSTDLLQPPLSLRCRPPRLRVLPRPLANHPEEHPSSRRSRSRAASHLPRRLLHSPRRPVRSSPRLSHPPSRASRDADVDDTDAGDSRDRLAAAATRALLADVHSSGLRERVAELEAREAVLLARVATAEARVEDVDARAASLAWKRRRRRWRTWSVRRAISSPSRRSWTPCVCSAGAPSAWRS
jgi:hypothetical protein